MKTNGLRAKILIFGIFRILGDAFAAPTAGTGGVARCHLHGLDLIHDEKIKNKNKIEKTFFSMRNIFSKQNRFLKKIENRYFSRKKFSSKKVFSILVLVFSFSSCIESNPCKWHRATPPVPAVGAANALRKSGKSRKSSIWIRFHRFW